MSLVEFIQPITGSWVGINRLRLMPDDDYTESAGTATIRIVASNYAVIEYTWFDGEAPQTGLMLIQGSLDSLSCVWVDSWHSSQEWMSLAGSQEDGVLVLKGSYPAESGPDWGWHIHVEYADDAHARLSMHNVVPGHDPYQVVELALERSTD